MLKLYRLTDGASDYWETWENDRGGHIVHWGALGTQGEMRTVFPGAGEPPTAIIRREIDDLVAGGFRPIDLADHAVLMVEYRVDGTGSPADLDKRHRLEARLDETLGWTGLGMCDGGSIGSGTMEVCSFVVDYEVARAVIERDLQGTEFADFSRIYDEAEG